MIKIEEHSSLGYLWSPYLVLYIIYSIYIISFNLHISHQPRRYLSPFYRWRHSGLEKIKDLPKTTSILSGKAEIKIHVSHSKTNVLPINPINLIETLKLQILLRGISPQFLTNNNLENSGWTQQNQNSWRKPSEERYLWRENWALQKNRCYYKISYSTSSIDTAYNSARNIVNAE